MMVYDTIRNYNLLYNSKKLQHIKFNMHSGDTFEYFINTNYEFSFNANRNLQNSLNSIFMGTYYGSKKYPDGHSELLTQDILSNKKSNSSATKRLALALVYSLKHFSEFWKNSSFIVPVPNIENEWDSDFKAVSIANRFSDFLEQIYDKRIPVKKFLKKHHSTNMKYKNSQERLDFFAENPNTFTVLDNSDLMGKTVMLIDDLITCGTTMNQCINKITAAGGRVYCLAAGHTMFG